MKRIKLYFRTSLSLMLCMALFICLSLPAFAQESNGLLDEAELQTMVDAFIEERGIDPKNFSIGYVYTGTGEEWYHNPDTWYYPASMYKVPLMMLLAEREADGFITQDSDINGYPLSTMEEYILSYSNNDYAHIVRLYLGGDEVWRQEAKKYTLLEDDDYHPDYMDYCYFSPRYITQVVKTLYNESHRFPNIIECMKNGRYSHDFRLSEHMNATYEIAQKYGSFQDDQGNSWNHNTGIIYTDTPFILTVMTLNVPDYEKVISDVAVMFTDYTNALNAELAAYEQQLEEEARKAEEEKAAAEAEQAAAEKAEQERIAAEEQQAIEAQAQQEKEKSFVKLGIIAGAVLFVILVIAIVLARRAKRRRREEFRRRFEWEMEQQRYRR